MIAPNLLHRLRLTLALTLALSTSQPLTPSTGTSQQYNYEKRPAADMYHRIDPRSPPPRVLSDLQAPEDRPASLRRFPMR